MTRIKRKGRDGGDRNGNTREKSGGRGCLRRDSAPSTTSVTPGGNNRRGYSGYPLTGPGRRRSSTFTTSAGRGSRGRNRSTHLNNDLLVHRAINTRGGLRRGLTNGRCVLQVCTGRTGVRRLRTGSTPWTRGGRKNPGSRWVRRTPGVPTVTSEVARQLLAATPTIQRTGTATMTHLATDHAVWWWTTVPYVTVKASDSHFTRISLSDRDPQLTIPIAQA